MPRAAQKKTSVVVLFQVQFILHNTQAAEGIHPHCTQLNFWPSAASKTKSWEKVHALAWATHLQLSPVCQGTGWPRELHPTRLGPGRTWAQHLPGAPGGGSSDTQRGRNERETHSAEGDASVLCTALLSAVFVLILISTLSTFNLLTVLF